MRVDPDARSRMPALVMLDPYGCQVFDRRGASNVVVGDESHPGVIAVDSDGSLCTGSATVVDSGNSGSITALPESGNPKGQIQLYAQPIGATTCMLPGCEPGMNIWPLPIKAPSRTTRAPVDHAYNCKVGYEGYTGGHPTKPPIAIPDCTETPTAHIDTLRHALGIHAADAGKQQFSAPPTGVSAPWTKVTNCDDVIGQSLVGNYWLACDLSLKNKDVVDIKGNVVMDGDLSLNGGSFSITGNPVGTLGESCMNSFSGDCVMRSSALAGYFVQRRGDIKPKGEVRLRNVAYIQNGGCIADSQGKTDVSLEAPREGPLAGLAYWGEGCTGESHLNGNSGVNVRGVFFAPDASFFINGDNTSTGLDAQFFVRSLKSSGNAPLRIIPRSEDLVSVKKGAGRLIR